MMLQDGVHAMYRSMFCRRIYDVFQVAIKYSFQIQVGPLFINVIFYVLGFTRSSIVQPKSSVSACGESNTYRNGNIGLRSPKSRNVLTLYCL